MPVQNLYLDTGAFSRMLIRGSDWSANDSLEAQRVLDAASRIVDAYCRRHFYAEKAVRLLAGNGKRELSLNEDLISLTALDTDDGDPPYTYATALVEGTDYELANEDDLADRAPWSLIRLFTSSTQLTAFPNGKRRVRANGWWGYSDSHDEVLTSAGVAVTGTLASSSSRTLTASAAAFPVIAPGATLLIENERVYVQAGSGTSFTVRRGVNGTTAASHAAAAISRIEYESDVTEAVRLLAGILWKRKDAPMLPIIAAAGVGDLQVLHGELDPHVEMSLTRLRRWSEV